MGGGRRQPDADAGESPFPRIVAWCSLVLALLLFLFNTVPAVRQRDELRARAADLQELRQRYDDALAELAPATPGSAAGADDLETVLLAIDRIGWTPEELRRSFPAPAEVGTYPVGPDPSSGRRR